MFGDLDERDSDDDSSVECIRRNTMENPADVGTSPKRNRASQVKKMTKAFGLGCPLAHKGPVAPKGTGMKVPKPEGGNDCPSDSVTQDEGAEEEYSNDSWPLGTSKCI
uniref:Uncharacterized protein n=1 Tax=Cannabis sativa TaxID=3483 RepID=A0A803PJT3_CANSA